MHSIHTYVRFPDFDRAKRNHADRFLKKQHSRRSGIHEWHNFSFFPRSRLYGRRRKKPTAHGGASDVRELY